MSRTYSRLLAFILLIYGLSIGVRFFFPVDNKPFHYQTEQTLEWEGAELPFSYLEFGRPTGKPPVILIPDPFTKIQQFESFSVQLSSDRKVIVPIFPVRNSADDLISHSPDARADMLISFFQKKGYSNIDLVGHGFGNSIAVRLIERLPSSHLRSYAMLSAIGVQEFHFLGYHVLNQPIYSVLYPVSWILEHGLPVAHWNRSMPINLEGVRFLNAMDQRPYRDIISGVDLPVHIIHSAGDRQISVNTAREHYRIVPQSTIKITEGDHSAIHDKSDIWAESYRSFLADIELNGSLVEETISTERRNLAEQNFNFGDVL